MSHCEHSCWAASPRSTITPLPRHPPINATASGYRHRHRRRPPQCEWSWLLPSPLQCECNCRSCRNQGSRRSANGAGCCPRRRSANGALHLPAALARPAQTDRSRCSASAPACCPCSTCSGRPGSTCSDRPQPPPQCACSDRPSLCNQGSHRSANGAPQCECTCPLPLLDLLRQTVAPQPRQPPQCEWSWLLPSPPQCECTCLLPSLDLLRQTVAPQRRQPAMRMHLPAALARPAPACCPCST